MADGNVRSWTVEVRKLGESGEDGKWSCVSECGDSATAFAVADALHNFFHAGMVADSFRIRVQAAGKD